MYKWTPQNNARGSLSIRLASAIGRATCVLLAANGIHVTGAPCTPRAIVIGVSIYKDPSWTLRRNAKNDAEAFRDWFQRYTICGSGGVSSGKPVVRVLTDNQASQAKILTALSSELYAAGTDDETFIFISAPGLKTMDDAEAQCSPVAKRRGFSAAKRAPRTPWGASPMWTEAVYGMCASLIISISRYLREPQMETDSKAQALAA